MEQFINKIWYGQTQNKAWWLAAITLWPLSWLFIWVSAIRRFAYAQGWLPSIKPPLPVIVVGNITAGGAGKTPTVIWLCQQLQMLGLQPGVISRGYGRATSGLLDVKGNTAASECGDEPRLIASRLDCPVVVAETRSEAAQFLCDEYSVDVIVCDDGMQHYALQRDLEIAVVDGIRRQGNGLRLPAGPLREAVARLQQVDMLIVNGGDPLPGEFSMQLSPDALEPLLNDPAIAKPLALESLSGQKVHAVAGIGHPQRFFDLLRARGLNVIEHPLPDHHVMVASDLQFGDSAPVLMTEKDAVKCRGWENTAALNNCWYLPVSAQLPESASERLKSLIETLTLGSK